jgi:ketosteroid isomerase-like protein
MDPHDPRRPAEEAAMTEHPNVELTRRGYEAFATGDLATLTELIADDVTWNVQGAGPLSGTYHGRDEVFGFFGRLAQETGGTFRLDVHDVLANDEHAVALCTLSASRGSKSLEMPVANVSHVRGGKITEFWAATADPEASIDFWS